MKNTLFALVFACVLSACGFTPVHAPNSMGKTAYKDIRVELVPTNNPENKQAGFLLSQRLRDRIGVTGDKDVLRIKTTVRRRRLGISGDDVASRYDVTLSARYTLIDSASGKVLDKGSVSTVSTFGSPTDPYGQQSSETNAVQVIASDVADRLLAKLAGYYAREGKSETQ